MATVQARAQGDILLTVQDYHGYSELTLSFPTDLSWVAQSGSLAGFGINHAAATNNPEGYQWFTSTSRDALAIADVAANQVVDVVVTDAGQRYVSTPQVHFIGGNGSGITATATTSVLNGIVYYISLENPGNRYTTPPTVQIDPPPVSLTLMPGQTNATLNFSSLTKANGTNYCVVITNNYGSVTSSVVPLFVYLPAQILATPITSNSISGLQLQFTGTPYFNYVLESTTNLTPPVQWQPIKTNYADVNGNWSFTITNLSSPSCSFYQAIGF